MKRIMLMLALVLLMAGLAQAQEEVIGDWEGVIKAGGAELRIAVHVTAGADGKLAATLDSLDQGALGIPASAVAFKDATLSFAVPAVGGSYQGKVNAAGTSIDGTWSQGSSVPLPLTRAAKKTTAGPSAAAATPSDIDGSWSGTLTADGVKLRLQFNLTNRATGLSATMDSLDQGARGMPVTTVTRDGATLTLELKQIGGTFTGTIDAAKATINGTWTQGGRSAPLVLTRAAAGTEKVEPKRPQNPAQPYPYREEEVSYRNNAANLTLGATLTIPPAQGPFPAVLLVTGSGAQDRDESLLGHRPFLVLADYLTRHGIAVLRADDRGVGKSTGSFAAATTADFATDAEAGLAYLQTRPEINHRKTGIIGHSEGGVIAPMVAARNPGVAFIVLMAGPGVPGDEILVAQNRMVSVASGMSVQQAEKNAVDLRDVLAIVKEEKDDTALGARLRGALAGKVPPAMIETQVRVLSAPWFRYFVAYDPAPALRQVTCAVLALNGDKDVQVPAAQNLPAIRRALVAAGNNRVQVVELPGLNHLFQTATTGAPSEYGTIEETIAPIVLDQIASWIAQQ